MTYRAMIHKTRHCEQSEAIQKKEIMSLIKVKNAKYGVGAPKYNAMSIGLEHYVGDVRRSRSGAIYVIN